MSAELSPELLAQVRVMTPEQRAAALRGALGLAARYENELGYASFYELVHEAAPPQHVLTRFYAAVEEAHRENKGVLIEAARGFYKTDSMAVVWGAWQIGLHPERANMLITYNDGKGAEITEKIADLIMYNPGWKLAFPHVVPDVKKGWGAAGYEVMCTEILTVTPTEQISVPVDYAEWRRLNHARQDPSFKGVGITSGDIVGSHPDGWIILDDIHNDKNSASQLQLNHVKTQVTDAVLPMRVIDESQPGGALVKTKLMVIGTPWTDDDSYQMLKDSGRFVVVSVPALAEVPQGTKGAVAINYQKLKGYFLLTWPERFGLESIYREYDLSGWRGFSRMYLLKLIKASEAGLKYFPYPAERIQEFVWPIVSGLDWASIRESKGRTLANRSYFAHYWAGCLPGGGLVVIDGVLEHLTQAQAETHLNQVQNTHRDNWLHTYFETLGKGEEAFVSILSRSPKLKLVEATVANTAKQARLEADVAPHLETGALLISDADTPALNALRKALEDYPFCLYDPLDALYILVQAGQFALLQFPAIHADPQQVQARTRAPNPWKRVAPGRAARKVGRLSYGG